MSNVFVPSSIRDKATRDTFIAVVKELNSVKTVTTSATDPSIYTPGKPGDVIFSESSNSIWVFSGSSWVLAADNTTTATVTLFNKNNVTSAPALPTGSFVYTFSSSALTGAGFNGWSQTPPSLDKGEYLWSIQAPAVSALTTDTINANEFSAPAIIGIGGEDGLAGNFSDLQGAIAQTQIPTGIIDSTRLANNAVIASKISANAVGANAIAANAITADKINVSSLDAISANLGSITVGSANIGNLAVQNSNIDNLAVDTIKVANDSITRQEFTSFATQTGGGPYSFSFNTSMTFTGSIIALATVQMFGTSSASSSVTFRLSIDGTQKVGISIGGNHCLGLQTMSGGADVSTGSRNITVTVDSISGVTSPSAKCQLTIFRRFK